MTATVEHVVTCAHCKSANVTQHPNSEGHVYCWCLTCGTRFWLQ